MGRVFKTRPIFIILPYYDLRQNVQNITIYPIFLLFHICLDTVGNVLLDVVKEEDTIM